MEKLIEFLLNNIYIVIVVGGFLLSVMSKMKGKGGGRSMRMPDFGGGGGTSADEADMPHRHSVPRAERTLPSRQPSAGRPQPAEVRRISSPGIPAAARAPYAEQDDSYLSATLREASSAAAAEKRQPQSAAPSHASFKQPIAAAEPDAAAMRKAVVWAEILGPPRAKRPWNKS